MMLRILILFLVLFGAAGLASARADVARGIELFERGEFSRAYQELLPDAEGGDARAQYITGVILLNDFAEPESEQQDAEYWILRAAEQNYLRAQTELARMYKDGDHVAQDLAKSVQWYARAAENGDVGAQLFVADAYAYGHGVEIDLERAYMWYDIALEYWGELAVRARDVIAKNMTPQQIARAEQQANEWRAARITAPPQ